MGLDWGRLERVQLVMNDKKNVGKSCSSNMRIDTTGRGRTEGFHGKGLRLIRLRRGLRAASPRPGKLSPGVRRNRALHASVPTFGMTSICCWLTVRQREILPAQGAIPRRHGGPGRENMPRPSAYLVLIATNSPTACNVSVWGSP